MVNGAGNTGGGEAAAEAPRDIKLFYNPREDADFSDVSVFKGDWDKYRAIVESQGDFDKWKAQVYDTKDEFTAGFVKSKYRRQDGSIIQEVFQNDAHNSVVGYQNAVVRAGTTHAKGLAKILGENELTGFALQAPQVHRDNTTEADEKYNAVVEGIGALKKEKFDAGVIRTQDETDEDAAKRTQGYIDSKLAGYNEAQKFFLTASDNGEAVVNAYIKRRESESIGLMKGYDGGLAGFVGDNIKVTAEKAERQKTETNSLVERTKQTIISLGENPDEARLDEIKASAKDEELEIARKYEFAGNLYEDRVIHLAELARAGIAKKEKEVARQEAERARAAASTVAA